MQTLDELRERVAQDRADVEAAERFLGCLLELDPHTSKYLTLRYLAKLTKVDVPQAFDLATYFASDRVRLLEQLFDFILEDDDEAVEIPGTDVTEAYRRGYMLHPVTGDVVEDWEQHVVTYFATTDLLARLLGNT